jgi:type I restriction enzyme R subunit
VHKIGGLVVDYVGIVENLDKALNFEEEEIEGVVFDFGALKQRFADVLSGLLDMFKNVPKEDTRESLLQALRVFEDKKRALEFKAKFLELKRLYEAISPDPFLVKYLKDYEWLIKINAAYNRFYNRRETILEEYGEKTKRLIKEKLLVKKIEKDVPILKIDEDYLDKLEKTGYSSEAKVREMRQAIDYHIRINLEKNPIYETLSQRLERILKIKDRKRLLGKLEKLVKEITEIESEASKLGLTDEEYALLSVLRKHLGKKDGELISFVKMLAQDIKRDLFRGWYNKKKIVLSTRKKVFDRCIAEFSSSLDKRTIWSMSGMLMKFILRYNP